MIALLRYFRTVVCLAALAMAACAPETDVSPPIAADRLFTNGQVFTGAAGEERAEAVAVRNGRIIAVGTSEEVRGYADAMTDVVDLGARWTGKPDDF